MEEQRPLGDGFHPSDLGDLPWKEGSKKPRGLGESRVGHTWALEAEDKVTV